MKQRHSIKKAIQCFKGCEDQAYTTGTATLEAFSTEYAHTVMPNKDEFIDRGSS